METKYKTHHIFEAVLLVIVLAGLPAGNLRAEETAHKEDSHIAWLKQHAIPLRSIDPNDEDFMDLEPLAKIFENVRIVQLGEQSHGEGATFHAKTRLVKFLHQKLGFDVLAFESGLYDCRKAWELLRSGMEPYEAFSHGVFGIWSDSEQVRPLIDYWGKVAKSKRPLELCGFDCQFSAKSTPGLLVKDVNALWDKLGPTAPGAAQRAAIVKTFPMLLTSQKPSTQERQQWHNAMTAWRKSLETARPSDALPEVELAFWRQFVAGISGFAAKRGFGPDALEMVDWKNFRDRQMARNLVWLAQYVYPKRKIIVWAASGHLMRNPSRDWYLTVTMGHEVWKEIGKETYTVAFTAAEGKHRWWWNWEKASQLHPPAPGSLEDLFVRAGFNNAFLDFRSLGPDGAWLKQKLTGRLVGYHNYEANWTDVFDGVVFIKKMFRSTPAGDTPLHCAASAGQRDVVESLIGKGADVNAQNVGRGTALHYAAHYGHKDIVELLITKGANVNAKNTKGQTPLDIALSMNHKDIARLLVEKGANITLHEAARMGDMERVEAFLKSGIDVNTKDRRGCTPLHYAARHGHKKIVELLLANMADVNAGEKYYGRTPAEFAMNGNHNEVVELLISKGADISPLHFALHMKDQAEARSMIEGGADVNKWTPYGTTPLDRAVDAGFKDIVELLIAKGANVNAKDNWGWTPLHSAVSYGSKDMVELLIAKGVDINVRDGDGRMPIRYAKNKGYTEIVELLRKHGAKE